VLSLQVKEFRALYAKVIVDKHEDVMSKFGAILAQGIIDAGDAFLSYTLKNCILTIPKF
jgi:26S proteasome regulatory subunit N2